MRPRIDVIVVAVILGILVPLAATAQDSDCENWFGYPCITIMECGCGDWRQAEGDCEDILCKYWDEDENGMPILVYCGFSQCMDLV